MTDERRRRVRFGEAFWRAHHEAWQRSDLNQREYCERHGIPLKAFGNWRARFKAEPEVPARKLLYRRGGLSPTLSPSLSPTLSHGAYPTMTAPSPLIVPPSRDGHRRRFPADNAITPSLYFVPSKTPRTKGEYETSGRLQFVFLRVRDEYQYIGSRTQWIGSEPRSFAKGIFGLCNGRFIY